MPTWLVAGAAIFLALDSRASAADAKLGSGPLWLSGGSADHNFQSASDAWAAWRGRPVTLNLAYPLRTRGWDEFISTTTGHIGAYTDKSIALIVQCSPFPTEIGATYAKLVAGEYDAHWRQFGENLKAREAAGFAPVILSVAWEANGTYMPWGYGSDIGSYRSPTEYIAAFRCIVEQLRTSYPSVKIAWIMNGHGTPAEVGSDSSALYPGDDCVDYIGVDYYDHYPSAASRVEFDEEGNAPDGIWWFLKLARGHGKTFLVPEWGIAPGSLEGNTTKDNPGFIRWMFDVFQDAHATGHMGGETYFNDPCGSGNVDSDLIGGCNPHSATLYLELYK